MDPSATGVAIANELRGDMALTNAVVHNGSGVAIGDVDGNGDMDLLVNAVDGSFANATCLRALPEPHCGGVAVAPGRPTASLSAARPAVGCAQIRRGAGAVWRPRPTRNES
jgi:hypothetical protein